MLKACYEAVLKHYGTSRAKRSQIPLMNHITEGLLILTSIQASEAVQAAFCLHPLVQEDKDLLAAYTAKSLEQLPIVPVLLAMEYRSVANEYLSTRTIKSLSEVRLSPLIEVQQMLIADKVQNKKDFMLYHYGKHERSKELLEYFNNWLEILGITEKRYQEFLLMIKSNSHSVRFL